MLFVMKSAGIDCRIFTVLILLSASCSRSQVPEFDENRAFEYLQEQCSFGPRNPGSQGHRKCLRFLVEELRKSADAVVEQPFLHTDFRDHKTYTLTNVIASFGKQGERILLCAHWDTRPWADLDPDPENRDKPILGANDGASGVAVLLEIARVLSRNEPLWGVDIVLFDGEDGGKAGDLEGFCLGSKHFARNKGDYQPEFGILVDMIGDSDLTLYKEAYSARYAEELTESVWSKAKEMGLLCFEDSVKYAVYDDHVPLLDAGIPVVDLIDFDYPYWHTTLDTPDKCSPESLQKIGDLLLHILYHGI